MPDGERACRFRCVPPWLGRDRETFRSCEGVLLHERKGDGGFGYDPLFLPNESTHTLPRSG